MNGPFYFNYTIVWDKGSPLSFDRARLCRAEVVFLYRAAHPITHTRWVMATDMPLPPDGTVFGAVPELIGGYSNNDEFWEIAETHARMNGWVSSL